MKKLLILFMLLSTTTVKADEGMWLPMLIDGLNYVDLQKKGLKLPPEEIYSVNHSGLKDAIIHFGNGYTGEIQAHSTLDHNYPADGFCATNMNEELPNEGLTAPFLLRIEDITQRRNNMLNDHMSKTGRNEKIVEISKEIEEEAMSKNGYEAPSNSEVAIMYSSKYSRTSNYRKYYIGQTRGLKRLNVTGKKQKPEADSTNRANADPSRKAKYGTLMNDSEDVASNVVGAQRGDDGREEKKALILAPFKWDFGEYDDSKIALELLKDVRNYKGRIIYKENRSKKANEVTIDDFLSLEQYDFIYISSHGSRRCQVREGEVEIVREGSSNMCQTLISTGIYFKDKDKVKVMKSMGKRGIKGLAFSKNSIYLKAEFFTENFNNLKNKVIIFSACETDQHNSLRNAVKSELDNGQAFLWSNSVYTSDAVNAYKYLMDRMLQYGETAPIAYKEMPDSLKNNLKSDIRLRDSLGVKFDVETTTSLKIVEKGNAMHLIEPVTFLDDQSKNPVSPGEIYPFEGIFDDEQNEKADFTLELLGYSKEQINSLTLSIKVDGKTVVDHIPLKAADKLLITAGKNDKSTHVKIKAVDLLKDLKKNKQVKFEAFFHLDETNYGYQKLMVSTENSDMRIEMDNDGEKVTLFYDADNEGLRVFYRKEEATIFGDEQGYYYVHAKGEGWMKTKMESIMSNLGKMIPIDPSFLASIPDRGTFYHKIPYFAAEITISKLEEMSDVRKISKPLDEKTVFLAKNRVTITFDKMKRLESIKEGSGFIKYYYESQTISFPDAKLVQMPW